MNGQPAPVPQPKDYYLGFNLGLDRQSIMNLMGLVQHGVLLQAKSITICITSIGGAPDMGLYAYEILSALSVPINTHAIGTVQSAAITLLMAGKRRTAAPGTNFLFHETVFNANMMTAPLRFDDLLGQADGIKQNDEWSHQLIAKILNKPPADVAKWFVGQTLRDTKFALDNGIIHETKHLVIPPTAEFAQVQYKF